MKLLDQTPLVIASAVTTLAFPPVKVLDVAQWNTATGVLDEWDIEIWAAGTTNLTSAELWGVVQVDKTIAADTFTAAVTDVCTAVAHGLLKGDGPIRLTTTGTLPAGLELDTDYWIGEVGSADTFKLSESLEDAIEGVFVDITDTGTGTHTLTGAGASGASNAIKYLSHGLLGNAADGAVALLVTKGYTKRVKHRPRTVAYGVSATLSAAVATTITATPVRGK